MGSVFYHVFHSPDLSPAFTYYVHAISTPQPELSKMWEMQFCTFFYSFYSRNFVLHLPHLLQVERYKWAIYQRCMRARWRRRWWKFHQLLKLIKVSDRSETFFQFIIITIIISSSSPSPSQKRTNFYSTEGQSRRAYGRQGQ